MPQKILIIEDNKTEALAFQGIVEQGGFTTELAHDGVDGLEKIKSFKPDLVMLDLMLPKMNGFDVLAKSKQDATTKNIPIIILTNLTQGDEAQKSFSLGADGHLVKTRVSAPDILNKIKKVLAKKSIK